MVMFFKKSDNLIEFYASIEGMEKDKNIVPYSAKKYLPSWWTNIPNIYNKYPTIRRCPGIPDFFTEGYILPMWTDVRFFGINKEGDLKFSIKNEETFNTLSGHPSEQFLSHYSPRIGDRDVESIVKFQSPWYVITPKGWSTLVLPLFYEFNQNFTILPGIVDTDFLHQMNHPSLFHSNGKNFLLKTGDPLCMYIPFKRTKTNFKIIKQNIKTEKYLNDLDSDWTNKQELDLGLGFGFKNAYRKMQKERRDDF